MKNEFIKKTESIYDRLLQISYNYDGYDVVYEENSTDPEIYAEINEIITRGVL